MNRMTSFVGLIFVTAISACFLGCGERTSVVAPPPPEVIVSLPLQKEVTQYLEFTGTTAALEFVEVRARVEGWLDSVNFTPGSLVKTGDLLFVIDPRPYQAKVDQSEAALKGRQAELNLKKVNLKRSEQLLATASISQLQYDIQKAEASVGEAQVGIAEADVEKAKLDLDYTRLTSPINGRAGRNLVDVGNLVGAGEKTLLTQIVNDSSVYVYFDVSERDVLMLTRMFPKAGEKVASEREKPPVYIQLADETGYPHEGKIDFVEPQVDPSTGTLRVRAIISNENGLLVPGLFARVRVPIQRKQAFLVPELAVGIAQAGRYVLIVNKDRVVEQRLVKTGQLEGSLRVIEEGLAKDDRVVVNGIQRARPGAKVSPKESPIAEAPNTDEKAAPSSGK